MSAVRESELIKRFEQILEKDGVSKCRIKNISKSGIGDFESYFDYLLDCKLGGRTTLSNEGIWTSMKMQLNWNTMVLIKLNEDYMKLQNKVRNLESDLEEMRKNA